MYDINYIIIILLYHTYHKNTMNSVLEDKKKLYDTLLAFPPFYTYIQNYI